MDGDDVRVIEEAGDDRLGDEVALRLLVAAAALCTVISADETVTLKRDAPAEDAEPEVQASMNSLGGAFMPAVGEDYENEAAKEAEHFGPQTVTNVWQHPQRPLPFYVLDGQKLADTEKLAWVRQELGEDADIETFCTEFLDIFADKHTTATAQKKTALRLWCMHVGTKSSRPA